MGEAKRKRAYDTLDGGPPRFRLSLSLDRPNAEQI